MRQISHVIAGETGTAGTRTGEVFDPGSGQVQAKVSLGVAADLERAVAAARAAQPAWAPQRQHPGRGHGHARGPARL
jgi:malonate-semialdehyde dehydrogenase (acetylating) / methylmalonate-semialdehyde dehydrogenase